MTQSERIDDADSPAPDEGFGEGVGPVQPIDPSRRQSRPGDQPGDAPPSATGGPDAPAPLPPRRREPPARLASSSSRSGGRRSRTAIGAVDRVRRTDFPLALRGYDRAAVDAYVAEVAQLVAELEATQLPETVVERALDEVGEQTSAILKRAHEAAEEIAARSRSHAEGRLDSAEREADLTRREAEDHVRRLEDDVRSIWQERQRLIEDIRRLADDVLALADDAIDRIPPPGGSDQDEQAPAPVTAPNEAEQTHALARDDVAADPGAGEQPAAAEEPSEEPDLDLEPSPGMEPSPGGPPPEDEDTAERPAGA